MKIASLFKRDIGRAVNGVVKADQIDPATVWQELEEFVVTQELGAHIRRFFTNYAEALSGRADSEVSGQIGVWVSGFFGSGKSHFIKILHYLLKNQPVELEGQSRLPFEFFESKLDDAMLLGDIKRSVASKTDVILFNIDAKASHQRGRDAILQVFLKVLNELQGYSGDHPHIAHMERYLDGRGKLKDFERAFAAETGSNWASERDAFEFQRDEVIAAFTAATGQSKESATKWIDGAEGNFSLTVENFCKWLREYLDSRGSSHRLVFLVDEVGQFIGTDSHLMLNLQTIAEEIGVVCKGRAWIVVTSQEDIDAVLGEMKRGKAQDFSKIQGRFKTRLSLSSANVDEVIQHRLLDKDDAALPVLHEVFAKKGDIIKNQLTFTSVGMKLRSFKDAGDFIANYPFVPYQFLLMQKIFESIRKAGATGLHLSRGERSILDAFQTAAKALRSEDVGVLVPLYRFYPAIESFLDTAVKRTVDQAKDRDLEEFDIELLKVLFLIRYVEEMKGNVDNLVTLCIDRIDADRLALRRRIEAALGRLERETLVSRSGDNYLFLTNEERDLSREIKATELDGAEEAKLLGELLFDDVLKGQRKHRFSVNRMDFDFNRLCDQRPIGNRLEGGLVVSVLTPLLDDYSFYGDPRCTLESGEEEGKVIVRLPEHAILAREVRIYCQTDKYLKRPVDGVSESTKRIRANFAEENRERRKRLVTIATDLLTTARMFVAGQPLQPKANGAIAMLEEALEYLIKNTFNKMGLLKRLHDEPLRETQAVLRANDIAQLQLALTTTDANSEALSEIRRYIELCTKTSRQIVLYDLLETKFAVRPFGWPPEQTQLLLAQLLVLGEISLVMDGAVLPPDKAYEPLTSPPKQRKVQVIQRRSSDPKAVQDARSLGKQIFAAMCPDGEDPLFRFLRNRLLEWQSKLSGWKPLAETGDYPGAEEIRSGLELIGPLVRDEESVKFIERFNLRKDDLTQLADDYVDLSHFFEQQRPTWERLRRAFNRFQVNRLELERHEKAGAALRRMGEILSARAPFGLISEVDDLIQRVEGLNGEAVSKYRQQALLVLGKQKSDLQRELDAAGVDSEFHQQCLGPFQRLMEDAARSESIPALQQFESEAIRVFDSAVPTIQQWIVQRDAARKSSGGVTSLGAGCNAPAPKPLQIIKPVELASRDAYIETEADVEAYLDRLRTALRAAIQENKRIQIR